MRTHTIFHAAFVLLGAAMSSAQTLSDLPNLSTVTQTTSSTTSTSSSATSSTSTSASSTSTTSASTTSNSGSSTTSASSTSNYGHSLSALPTIAGAGIPTMVIPYTASAPFMQHSSLPEGTVFIAVGAVLAFLGLCVLLWRGFVAWSISRSVKRAAMASIRGLGAEKSSTNWGGSSTAFNPSKKGVYKDVAGSVSMEALTSSGKPLKSHFKDQNTGRSTPPPANLFFSPTAHARADARPLPDPNAGRQSSYLPAGYYAAPSAHIAGGARNTVIGGQAPPYSRSSMVEPSPPGSPSLRPSTSQYSASNDYFRATSSREGMRQSLYNQPSNSSLAVGLNTGAGYDSVAGGSRAPSAYLDDLFENHTAMASHDHI